VAVTLGTLVESELARRRGLLEAGVVDRLTRSARLLVTETEAAAASTVAPEALWSAMGGDKKVEGSVLKLPVPVALGAVELVDLPLDARGLGELESALGCLASLR
jgi:3-dehydroquinate synthetase